MSKWPMFGQGLKLSQIGEFFGQWVVTSLKSVINRFEGGRFLCWLEQVGTKIMTVQFFESLKKNLFSMAAAASFPRDLVTPD
jgi:hypothetical protein